MSVVKELLRGEQNGSISFGDYTLDKKAKLDNFEHGGDIYKVKTFYEITKLEKNGMFLYESVPGTSVFDFAENSTGIAFTVEGEEDAQITIGLEDDSEYEVFIDDASVGTMKTNLAGKINVSVELAGIGKAQVKLLKRG